MVKIFKSDKTQLIYIQRVGSVPSEDIKYIRDGDKFTIDRINTKIVEIYELPYTEFRDFQNNSFASADAFEDYLLDMFDSNEPIHDEILLKDSITEELYRIEMRNGTLHYELLGA